VKLVIFEVSKRMRKIMTSDCVCCMEQLCSHWTNIHEI